MLYGKVVHTVYNLELNMRGAFQAWNVQNARSAEADVGNKRGWVELDGEARYNITGETYKYIPGQSYRFPKRCFHRTDVTGLTITLCRKLNQEDVPARILARYGRQPRHGFEHDKTAYAVTQRSILTDAIQALRGIARAA